MKYDVILADPPWHFESFIPGKNTRSAENHYPTMSTPEICDLPVGDLAADNAALFLWAVWPRVFDAKDVIDAWGFEYRSLAWCWVKANKSGFGFFTGMGYYFRQNTEPCFLAIRGSMPAARHDLQALIYSAVRDHSQKPTDQYRKIEALYPEKRYLELFARRTRPGWDAWGNEVPNSVEMEVSDAS